MQRMITTDSVRMLTALCSLEPVLAFSANRKRYHGMLLFSNLSFAALVHMHE